MTKPVTTSNAPTPLKQGAPAKPVPAKHATAHRVANAKAAVANKRSGK